MATPALVIMVREPSNIGFNDDVSTEAERLKFKYDGIIMDLDTSQSECYNAGLVNTNAAQMSRDFAVQTKAYLIGHGDWEEQKIGGKDANWFANVLQSLKTVKVLSIVSCSMGRDKGTNEDVPILWGRADSFASILHKALGDLGTYITIYARVFDVKVLKSGVKQTEMDRSKNKSLRDATSKRAASKLVYFWDGDRQKRDFVKSKDENGQDIPEVDDDFTNLRLVELLGDL